MGSPVSWQHVRGTATRVAVGPNGTVLHVNSAQKIYYLQRGNTWKHANGLLADVAVSPTEVVGCNSKGEIYSCPLDSSGNPMGNGKWTRRPGNIKRISVNPNGNVWGIKGEVIYAATSTPTSSGSNPGRKPVVSAAEARAAREAAKLKAEKDRELDDLTRKYEEIKKGTSTEVKADVPDFQSSLEKIKASNGPPLKKDDFKDFDTIPAEVARRSKKTSGNRVALEFDAIILGQHVDLDFEIDLDKPHEAFFRFAEAIIKQIF